MDGDFIWVVFCVICSVFSFLFGRHVEKRAQPFSKGYEHVEGYDDELPLKANRQGDLKEVEFLKEQLKKERELQQNMEGKYKAEIKSLNNKIRDLSNSQQTHKERSVTLTQKRKEEVQDLISEMDKELEDRPPPALPKPASSPEQLEQDIDRELIEK